MLIVGNHYLFPDSTYITAILYKTLTQVENGLWAENAEYILDCYNEEK